jgi:hypothetical protein
MRATGRVRGELQHAPRVAPLPASLASARETPSPARGEGKISVTDPLTFVPVSDTYRPNLAHCSDAVREAFPNCGASAVPAGGLATRSRAALGINPSALRPGCAVRAGLRDRQGWVTPAQRDTQNVFRHVPGSLAWSCAEDDESPFGESRGGTPTVVRLTLEARPCPSARHNHICVCRRFASDIFFRATLRSGLSEEPRQAPPPASSLLPSFALHVTALP